MVRGLLAATVLGSMACGTASPPPPPWAAPDAGPPPVRETSQEPVAVLAAPAQTTARVPITVDSAGSVDVDGTVAQARFSFGDNTPEATGPTASHAYERPGSYVITLVVVDNAGKEGRARRRITVDPPPDQVPPQVAGVRVTLGGSELSDGARVAGGSMLEVTVDAADTQGNLESITLTAEGALGAVMVDPATRAVTGAAASGVFTLEAPQASGALTLRAVAVDAYANRAVERVFTLVVFLAGADTDQDGLPDGTDPDPTAFNGLRARVYTLTAFPRDLLQRQRAEAVWDALRAATPVFTANVGQGFLSQPVSSAPVNTLPGLTGAPANANMWAIVYEGTLKLPTGADRIVVNTGADDTSTIWLADNPVASADEEFATDFFRAVRLPPQSAPVMVTGSSVAVRIMVAQEQGPYAWDNRFTFNNASGVVMAPAMVGQGQFLAP